MNSTLRLLGSTLSQVAPSFGSRIGQTGLLVAGLMALATAYGDASAQQSQATHRGNDALGMAAKQGPGGFGGSSQQGLKTVPGGEGVEGGAIAASANDAARDAAQAVRAAAVDYDNDALGMAAKQGPGGFGGSSQQGLKTVPGGEGVEGGAIAASANDAARDAAQAVRAAAVDYDNDALGMAAKQGPGGFGGSSTVQPKKTSSLKPIGLSYVPSQTQQISLKPIGLESAIGPASEDSASEQRTSVSDQDARNIGRIFGGILGFGLGKVAEAGGVATALLAAGGAVLGGHAVKESQKAEKADRQSRVDPPQDGGRVDEVVRAALALEFPAPPAGKGRALPTDVHQGMSSLVLDALAMRLLAQQAWRAASHAEVNAAVRPADAVAAQEKRQTLARFQQAMRDNNQAFFQFRNAVGALRTNGFNVDPYLALNRRLSQPVDHKGLVALDHPAVHDRAYALMASAKGDQRRIVDLVESAASDASDASDASASRSRVAMQR